MTPDLLRKGTSNIIFFLRSIFGGLIAGILFGTVGSFIYLLFLFPIMMGFVSAHIIDKNIGYTKVREKYFVLITSILMVIALYTASHYMRYVIISALGGLETEYSSFLEYMVLKAQQGISIGKFYSRNRLNLGPIFTTLYWIVEMVIMSAITVSIANVKLNEPFCDFCNAWYSKKKHLGGVPIIKKSEIMSSLARKDYQNIGTMLEENTEAASLELYLQSCDSCSKSNSFLNLTVVGFANGKVALTDLTETTLNPQEKETLLKEIKFSVN